MKCVTRQRRGKKYAYRDPTGRTITDPKEIARLNKIGMPPAYTQVCLSTDPRSKLQGTGVDKAGRTQYRYSHSHTIRQSQEKFQRIVQFGHQLGSIRQHIKTLLRSSNPNRRSNGVALSLMDRCMFRPGSQHYLKQNGTRGATTLAQQNFSIRGGGGGMRVRFKGKAGVTNSCDIQDTSVIRAVKDGHLSPGRLQRELPDGLKLKDFRTFGANVQFLKEYRGARKQMYQNSKKRLKAVLNKVAETLSHTPTVCKKNYIHPRLIDAVLQSRVIPRSSRSVRGLTSTEEDLLDYLEE